MSSDTIPMSQPELGLGAKNPVNEPTLDTIMHCNTPVLIKEFYDSCSFVMGFRAVIDNALYYSKDKDREFPKYNGVSWEVVNCKMLNHTEGVSEIRCVLRSYKSTQKNWKSIVLKGIDR